MKKLTSFVLVALICTVGFNAKADDATGIALWSFPLQWGFPWDAENLTHPHAEAIATLAAENFDAQNSDFDNIWSSISNEYTIANAATNAGSANGSSDFQGSFKVLYDNGNIYVLLKYIDEDVTGSETTEIMWSQDMKIDAIPMIFPTEKVASQYVRYFEFGGAKATFSNTAFTSAFIVEGSKESVNSQLNFAATPAVYANNLFVNDHTSPSAPHTRKLIYSIGFPALTGELRPTFNIQSWGTLNGGKGITFDIKVNDNDANDIMSTDATPVPLPAGYWWNSTNNAGWDITSYSGYLKTDLGSGVSGVKTRPSIFKEIKNDYIILNEYSDIKVFSTEGKQVLASSNSKIVNMKSLSKGVYIVNANNETIKVIR